MSKKRYFFCGIGGSGMSALAKILLSHGHMISGSDRDYDRALFPEKFDQLKKLGIDLYPQDGSGLNDVDILVVSTAVEDTIPDVKAALKLKRPILKRAELLAEIFNAQKGVAIGGTSGKSTVTGMLAHILTQMSYDPTVMNGAKMLNSETNALTGKSDIFVIESCESDGSIALYEPHIAVLTNITLDHKTLPELRELFSNFLKNAKHGCAVNIDDPEAAQLKNIHPNTLAYSLEDSSADIYRGDLKLLVPGKHNKSNALAACTAAKFLGISVADSLEALENFQGIQSRLEVVGSANNITVIDDFAHNPDKIKASLQTLKEDSGRLIVMYQSHGFGPTRLMWDDLIHVFSSELEHNDLLYMPEIHYAGGTAQKNISSKGIIESINTTNKNATFALTKDEITPKIIHEACPGDRIVIMGARDDKLREMARSIAHTLESEPS